MHRCVLPLTFLAAVTATAASFAQAPAAANKASLTRTELRVCMQRQSDIDRRRAVYDREVKQLNQTADAVSKEGEALNAEQGKVDKKSAAAVNDFAQRVAAYEKRTEAYNAKVKTLEKSNSELQALSASHQSECGQRTFNAIDREAILSEQQAASAAKR